MNVILNSLCNMYLNCFCTLSFVCLKIKYFFLKKMNKVNKLDITRLLVLSSAV